MSDRFLFRGPNLPNANVRNRLGLGGLLPLACFSALTIAGCGGALEPRPITGGGVRSGTDAVMVDPAARFGGERWASLLPDRIRVQPLTRVAADGPGMAPAGEPRVVCHVELLDRFGHGVKALGVMRVELYRPAGASGGGGETQELVWTVDLSDPADNAAYFDGLVGRAYVVNLVGLPGWLAAWTRAGGTQSESPTDLDPWATIRVTFTFIDHTGQTRRVSDTFRLTPGR